MTDKNLKILSGMGIDPLEPRPNYNVCFGNRGGRIMTDKEILEIEAMATRTLEVIKGDIEAIKWHAERIDSFNIVSHENMEKLKRFLEKLDRDETEYRAYMRIAEVMKDD